MRLPCAAAASSLAALACAALASAQGSGGTRCGDTQYSAVDVGRALAAACRYVREGAREGARAGGSSYPHDYRNLEGFDFKGLDAPFYEFPLLASKRVYGGGRPGADRVIITEDCSQAGQLTHHGAGGNSFVGCSGTS